MHGDEKNIDKPFFRLPGSGQKSIANVANTTVGRENCGHIMTHLFRGMFFSMVQCI